MKDGGLALGAMALLMVTLLTVPVQAGDLNPPGTPASTMKTLDQIPPTWDQVLPANDGPAGGCSSSRFKCVMGDAAVLDKETGLVWEKIPSTDYYRWSEATSHCILSYVGGRRGWRLPTVQELGSLIDPNAAAPHLPPGNPFTIQLSTYWTATTSADDPSKAWEVYTPAGGSGTTSKAGSTLSVLCVRGPQAVDPQ